MNRSADQPGQMREAPRQAARPAAYSARASGGEQRGQETAYLIRRAETQLLLAQAATLPAVTSAHYRLANAYLDRAETLEQETAPTELAA